MAEKKGFEPLRRCRPPGFQDQSLQPDLGISPFFPFKEHVHYIIIYFFSQQNLQIFLIFLKIPFIFLIKTIIFTIFNKKLLHVFIFFGIFK